MMVVVVGLAIGRLLEPLKISLSKFCASWKRGCKDEYIRLEEKEYSRNCKKNKGNYEWLKYKCN